MHELGIARNVVSIVADAAKGRKVRRVTLKIGSLAGIMPDAIAFCLPVVAEGTALEGTAFDIEIVEARGQCRSCHAEFALTTLYAPCACGSREISRLSGEELKIATMEVEEAA